MKFVVKHPYADPETAARKLVELADAFDPVQELIYIEQIRYTFLLQLKGSVNQYAAGLKRAVERGWLEMHERGTFVKLTQVGKDLL